MLLSSAVQLWRGPALADVQDAPFAVLARQRLEEERLTAAEKLAEARLALGQHRELVPELEALIGGSPYRERFHAQLMLALYRSGRQAEALAAFGRARDLLAGALGIEPGRELRELQRSVLQQAPELEPDGGQAAGQAPQHEPAPASRSVDHRPAAPGGTSARKLFPLHRGRAWRWAAAAAAVGLTVAIGVPVLLSTGSAAGGVLADRVGEVTAAGGISHSLALPDPPGAVVAADGSVWVTSPEGDVVYRIDPDTALITQTIPVGAGPSAITAAGPDIWVANTLAGTVSRISPVTSQVVHTISVGTEPTGIASGGGSVWVADAAASTLRVVSAVPPTSIDPALLYPWAQAQFSDATYDTLVTFQKTGGSSGLQLVPDLALAMPTVTADGTVYTFTLRPGSRYSTGQPVRPEDFRYAIERVLDLNPTAASFLDGIAGTADCVPGKLCNLAGVTVNDPADTVTFRLTAPDPDFLDKLAFEFTAPVPSYIPARDIGTDPVPGTGPYVITRYVPGRQVVFARNRYFREWSAAAQPDGSPDRIVWTFGTSLTQEITQIETGQADWTDDTLPGVAALAAQFPGQVHISPLPEIVYTGFNTRAAPFNDPAVRRAFSLAADRSRFAALLGGPDLAVPTCQILPPGIPGYQPYCPFTADASTSGTWVGPDLAAARSLVAASGTKGMRVTVWTDDAPPDGTTAAFAVSVLRELGYQASLHIASHAAVVQAADDSRRQIQATDGVLVCRLPFGVRLLRLVLPLLGVPARRPRRH